MSWKLCEHVFIEFITPYIILNSNTHIVWGLFYFEITSNFLMPSFKNTLSSATYSFYKFRIFSFM